MPASVTADMLRKKFLSFFEGKGHKVIPSSSLLPENDPSVLFTPAGMHPLIPYLMGAQHPEGRRLCDVQKCIRTIDIDEVGDASHLTFFEMLGNWSLGEYFKKEAIAWSWEFLTSPQWLGLNPERLAFSVFEGDEDAPRDEVSAQLWRDMGVPEERIFFLPKEQNWWIAGSAGPCGPDTEMFVITDKPPCGPDCSPACSCGRYLEIWNDVFMQYNKLPGGAYEPLSQKNVDTGMGLERTLCVLTGTKSVYDTEFFADILAKIEVLSGRTYGASEEITRAMRIVADHMRTATFILGDDHGIGPSNVDQGYILRRLIRRAVRHAMQLGIEAGFTDAVARVIIDQYGELYGELRRNAAFILDQFRLEEDRFSRTLKAGLREFEKVVAKLGGASIDGPTAFRLYDTFGFPIEIICELAAEKGLTVDTDGFTQRFKQHQALSSAGAEQRFKGGLSDATDATARLHTATHLMLAALRRVLGPEVAQKGSNITPERLRFDFSWPHKMTPEQIAQVQDLVNRAIQADMPISFEETTVEDAKARGAVGQFEDRYGAKVKVYAMGDFSLEICGGPHAGRTGELGRFHIQKEESSSSGVRRIKATLAAE